FFMKNRLARDPGLADAKVGPRNVNRVGGSGAGLMGSGIVAAHARSGIPTAMVDVDDARLQGGMTRAHDVVMSRIKVRRATPKDMASMLAHISTSSSPQVFADCDVVIEAVTENEALKKEVYKGLAQVTRNDAILASNTSTISITRMAESAPNPAQFIGMHFFS